MKTPVITFDPNAIDLRRLKEEHSEIYVRSARLDEAIGLGLGLPWILEASADLIHAMLMHFAHEEKFLGSIPGPALERQRSANLKVVARLFHIKDGLTREQISSARELVLLSKSWMERHVYVERDEFECEGMTDDKPRLSA